MHLKRIDREKDKKKVPLQVIINPFDPIPLKHPMKQFQKIFPSYPMFKRMTISRKE